MYFNNKINHKINYKINYKINHKINHKINIIIKSPKYDLLAYKNKKYLGINIKLSRVPALQASALLTVGKTPQLRHRYFYKCQYPPCIFLLKK